MGRVVRRVLGGQSQSVQVVRSAEVRIALYHPASVAACGAVRSARSCPLTSHISLPSR